MGKLKSLSQIAEFIVDIENTYTPQNWKYGDINLWPILRIEIYHKLSLILLNSSHIKQPSRNYFKIITSLAMGLLKRPPKNKDYLFVSDNVSFLEFENIIYDKFCDPLILHLSKNGNNSFVKWVYNSEQKYSKLFFEPFNLERDFLFQRIRFFLSKGSLYQFKLNYKSLENIFDQINVFVGANDFFNIQEFKKRMVIFGMRRDLFIRKLDKLKPKKVFIVDYYNFNNMALINACKSKNINTFDIQHGAQSQFHCAYSMWTNIPENGYNVIPDSFLVWSEYEQNLINDWLNNKTRIYILPKLANLIYSQNFDLYDQIISSYVSKIRIDSKKINVLFTLQYGITYPREIFELIKKTQSELNWLIRKHPSDQGAEEFLNNFSNFDIYNFEINLTSSLPLDFIMSYVDIHVTHSSSVILECIPLKIKTIFLDIYGVDFYKDQVSNEYILFESNIYLIEQILLNTNKSINTDLQVINNSYSSLSKILN